MIWVKKVSRQHRTRLKRSIPGSNILWLTFNPLLALKEKFFVI